MKLYTLGEIGWKETQLLYHAMAYTDNEGVIICRPLSPYFCVGFHQDVGRELNVEYLDSRNIPYFRRETGGGTVRLDRDQVFYQIIRRRDDPDVSRNPETFSREHLKPVVGALADMGMDAKIVPPSDVHVWDKKISGNGGGHVGEAMVLVGDLLFDFDPSVMCKGLRCPTEAFHRACRESMERNMTTVNNWVPGIEPEDVEMALIRRFADICDEGRTSILPDEVTEKAAHLEERMLSDKWLFFEGPRRPGRSVKIREGVHIGALAVPLPPALAHGAGGRDSADHNILSFEISDGMLKWYRIEDPTREGEPVGYGTVHAVLEALKNPGDRLGTGRDLDRLLWDMGLDEERRAGVLAEIKMRIKMEVS